jgi:hypothetical protein
VEGFRSLFSLLLSVFFQDGEAATMSWSQSKVLPILCTAVVHPAPTEGTCSRVPGGLLGLGWFSHSLVWFHINHFWSTVFIIYDGCCSDALTSCLSTTTSFSPVLVTEGQGWRRLFGLR